MRGMRNGIEDPKENPPMFTPEHFGGVLSRALSKTGSPYAAPTSVERNARRIQFYF